MPQLPQKSTKQPAKPVTEKVKELRYNKVLAKDTSEGMSQPFLFDILNQLKNIPAHITHYELLRLSKTTRNALKEALVGTEVYII